MRTTIFVLIGIVIGCLISPPSVVLELEPPAVIQELPRVKEMTITAFSLRKKECNEDLNKTALMVKPKPGMTAAVSRDNLHMLNRKIYIEGIGVWKVESVMNERWKDRIDLLMGTKDAIRFGITNAKVVLLD